MGSGVFIKANLLGVVGGYHLIINIGQNSSTLVTARGDLRLFTLDNASKFLNELGVSGFYVDTSRFIPGRMRKARPDRAQAMSQTRSSMKQQSLI